MKTLFVSRPVSMTALALITFALVGLTACQQDGTTSPIAAMDNLATASAANSTASLTNDTQSYGDLEMDVLALAGGTETRPEAVLEINRRPLSRTSTESGGEASARFDSTLNVKGVSVTVLGTTYQFVTPPLRTQNGNGRGTGGNGNPNSTNANAQRPERIASTLFVFPAPPTTSAALPALIALTPVNAAATFTVNGYTLADNTLDIPGTIAITSLKDGDALSRSASLTVRWSVAGTFTNGVITVRNVLDSAALAGKSRREAEQLLRSLPKPIAKQLSAGASSADFTAAELTALQAGTAEISLGIVNAKRTNNDKALLLARTRTGARVRLQ